MQRRKITGVRPQHRPVRGFRLRMLDPAGVTKWPLPIMHPRACGNLRLQHLQPNSRAGSSKNAHRENGRKRPAVRRTVIKGAHGPLYFHRRWRPVS